MSMAAFTANLAESKSLRDNAWASVEAFKKAGMIWRDAEKDAWVAKGTPAQNALRDYTRHLHDVLHWEEELHRASCEAAGVEYVHGSLRKANANLEQRARENLHRQHQNEIDRRLPPEPES